MTKLSLFLLLSFSVGRYTYTETRKTNKKKKKETIFYLVALSLSFSLSYTLVHTRTADWAVHRVVRVMASAQVISTRLLQGTLFVRGGEKEGKKKEEEEKGWKEERERERERYSGLLLCKKLPFVGTFKVRIWAEVDEKERKKIRRWRLSTGVVNVVAIRAVIDSLQRTRIFQTSTKRRHYHQRSPSSSRAATNNPPLCLLQQQQQLGPTVGTIEGQVT